VGEILAGAAVIAVVATLIWWNVSFYAGRRHMKAEDRNADDSDMQNW
jgi:hypothetical protein